MSSNVTATPGKSDISRIYEARGVGHLAAACVALVLTSVISVMQNSSGRSGSAGIALTAVIMAFFSFAYIISIRGFLIIDKAYKLRDGRSCYYLGRRLAVLTGICFAVNLLCEGFMMFSYASMSQYAAKGALTAEEARAVVNLHTLTAYVMLIMQVFALSTCFIIYLFKIRGISESPGASNFALLTALLMLLQLVIGLVSSVYTLRRSTSDYLVGFSSVLLVIKYIVGLMFFMYRRKKLAEEEL